MKILVVDDDKFMLNLLRDALRYAGFNDVTTADSAVKAAVAVAEAESRFDCFFVDFKMPEINGDYLCSWIRGLPDYKNTPIIMVTALSDKPYIDRAFVAGASDYITKPIKLSDLMDRTREIGRQLFRNKLIRENLNKNADEFENARLGRTDFEMPRIVGGFDCEIELVALEKYLTKLSQTGNFEMTAFAFAIADAAKLHFLSSPDEFKACLVATGQSIISSMGNPRPFLSYAGNGTFVGVVEHQGFDDSTRDKLETDVQHRLLEIATASAQSELLAIRPTMGVPRKLAVGTGSNALDVLYRTIVEVEKRSKDLRAVA